MYESRCKTTKDRLDSCGPRGTHHVPSPGTYGVKANRNRRYDNPTETYKLHILRRDTSTTNSPPILVTRHKAINADLSYFLQDGMFSSSPRVHREPVNNVQIQHNVHGALFPNNADLLVESGARVCPRIRTWHPELVGYFSQKVGSCVISPPVATFTITLSPKRVGDKNTQKISYRNARHSRKVATCRRFYKVKNKNSTV